MNFFQRMGIALMFVALWLRDMAYTNPIINDNPDVVGATLLLATVTFVAGFAMLIISGNEETRGK
jgi:hypothetical protein